MSSRSNTFVGGAAVFGAGLIASAYFPGVAAGIKQKLAEELGGYEGPKVVASTGNPILDDFLVQLGLDWDEYNRNAECRAKIAQVKGFLETKGMSGFQLPTSCKKS